MKTALSLGGRLDRDGAFSSRRGTGEGLFPFASGRVQLKLRNGYRLLPPVRSASCPGANRLVFKRSRRVKFFILTSCQGLANFETTVWRTG